MLALLSFGSAPLAWPAENFLSVVVVSDLNGSYGTIGYSDRVRDGVQQIIALKPDLVIVTGDVIAGQRPRLLARERLGQMWDAYTGIVLEALTDRGIPVAMTPGNHDASAYPAFAGERALYRERWRGADVMLEIVDRGNFPFHYAFEAGETLFISLDVTTTGVLPDDQFEWLENLLTRTAGSFEHRVVFSHVPVWPFATGREREATRDLRLHALLASAGVDLYLSGHHHAFYPGFRDGVAYVSQACLGSGPRRLLGTRATSAYGYSLLEIDESSIRLAGIDVRDAHYPIRWSSLPEYIGSGDERLLRADIAEAGIVELDKN